MISGKYISRIIVVVVTCWIGWHTYAYFFDTTVPVVTINGIDDHCYCCGDVQCCVQVNKNGVISLLVDNQVIIANNVTIKTQQDGNVFAIPTETLCNGKHTLKIDFTDATYNKNKQASERDFYVDNQPLQAVLIKQGPYKVVQGRTLHIQFQVNKNIKQASIQALSCCYECFPESKNSTIYECFIPIACEERPNEYLFVVDIEDNVGNKARLDNMFHVAEYSFKKEALTVTQEKVEEEKTLGRDGKDLEVEIQQLIAQSPREKLWKGVFCTPIEVVRVSCEYGTIRTTQHKGRYAHKAVDVINAPRSVVWAPQDGIIIVKDRFAPSGNTVIIDHGLGIFSLFYHLDSFADIEVGKKIGQGNPIGTIGKTGFATGYHLHWEMRINNIPVDPFQWVKLFQ